MGLLGEQDGADVGVFWPSLPARFRSIEYIKCALPATPAADVVVFHVVKIICAPPPIPLVLHVKKTGGTFLSLSVQVGTSARRF